MAITFMGRRGNWEIRDFHGYFQSREIYQSGRRGPWVFNVTGFTGPQHADGSDSIGNVLMADEKTKTACPISETGYSHGVGKALRFTPLGPLSR